MRKSVLDLLPGFSSELRSHLSDSLFPSSSMHFTAIYVLVCYYLLLVVVSMACTIDTVKASYLVVVSMACGTSTSSHLAQERGTQSCGSDMYYFVQRTEIYSDNTIVVLLHIPLHAA